MTQPDGLLPRHNLLGAVIDTDWATRLDMKIARHIISRYYSKFGNARASLRFLEQATGAQRPNVIASVRRLVDRQVFSVIREGRGTRPTEYGLNFHFLASGIADDTTSENEPSGIADDTSCGIAYDTSSAASGIADDTESYLLKPDYNPGLQVNSSSARLRASAAEAAPASAELGFEDFFKAYPRRHQKPKARAAWAKLNPDNELADRIVAAASRWAAHYEANPVDPKWIPEPANWLAGERYDEDLPAVFEGKPARAERQPKAAKPKAANNNRPANIKGGVTSLPRGEHLVEVIGYTDGDPWAAQAAVKLSLRTEGAAAPFTHECYFAHPDDDEEGAGRRSLHTLVGATGGSPANDNNPDPVGCWVWAVVSDVVTYRAALAPKSAQSAAN